ncbi:MAG TPA: GTPase HflX [Euzebyales bacterium]|nr:GTPase HflX [Euzebyales bacterium]
MTESEGSDIEQGEQELTRAALRRAGADRVADDAPREGVDIIRPVERAVLVAVRLPEQNDQDLRSSLDELELLVDTAGGVVVDRYTQRRERPDPATFIGRGKVAALREQLLDADVDTVIFNDELTPAQQRNLEEALATKVLDRNIVIMDIFAQHASSREGKLQVELAQLTYLLSRLRGWGQALSRQAGRIGTRGPGESQLEVDRRKIARRITKLRAELAGARQTRELKTRRRERNQVPVVALVGYTNAGKSTLLNRLTGASVGVADQLFATLDVTARRLELSDGRTAIATDTVGFIQKLPTQLIEAFKSTLEQTLDAALLLHVCDAGHPRVDHHIRAVDAVLEEIGAIDIPRLLVLNKIDTTDAQTVARLSRSNGDAVAVSARTGDGIEELIARVSARLSPKRRMVEALVPYEHADLVALAHRDGTVLKEEHRPEGTYVVAQVERAAAQSLEPYSMVSEWGDDTST